MIAFFWPTIFFALVAPSAALSQTAVRRQRTVDVRRYSAGGSVLQASVDDDGVEGGFGTVGARGDGDGGGGGDAVVLSSPLLLSRRTLLRSTAALSASGLVWGADGGTPAVAASYKIRKVEPDEKDIYRTAQKQTTKGGRPLKVLWLGSGAFALKTSDARSGIYKDLFRSGTEVTALDLLQPTTEDIGDAKAYAVDHGYSLNFRNGDATRLASYYEPESFDVVVTSLFLCQDFDPAQVCREIHRVLKPGGRYGFYEHVDEIDQVVIGKVFGDRSVIKVEADYDKFNVLAGVVKKV